MAAVRLRTRLLLPSVFRGVLGFLMPISSHTDNRSHGDSPLATKTLNYLRNAEKYAATTQRGHVAFGPQNPSIEAALMAKLGKLTSSGSGQLPIRSLNKTELLLLLSLLSTGQFLGTWLPVLNEQLDCECARRVTMWDASTCLLVLDLWLSWLGPSTVLKHAFYKRLIREWHIVPHSTEPDRVIQLLFYVGLAKQAPEPLMHLAEKSLEGSLASLSQDDLTIVCQGFFKTRTKMASVRLLAAVSDHVKAMVSAGSSASDIIICFLKVLRHARYEDPDLCIRLDGYLKTRLCPRNTPLVVCAHYAAFFANVRYYNRELFCKLEACVLRGFEAEIVFLAKVRARKIKDMHPTLLSRMKDVARILWAMSASGHQPEQEDFWQAAVRFLRMRMQMHVQYLEPRHFIDCLHSLALVGIFPEDLMNLMPRLNFDKLQESKTVLRQVYALYESLKIECAIDKRELRFFQPMRLLSPSYRCNNMNVVEELLIHCLGSSEHMCRRHFLLQHIPIEGFELLLDNEGKFCNLEKALNYKNCTKVALEVVESTKCMQKERQLPGQHAMKIRQLRKLGFRVVTILPQDILELEGKSFQEQTSWLELFLKSATN